MDGVAVISVRTPLQHLHIEQIGGTRKWLVCETYTCFVTVDGTEHKIVIPAGFVYDRASVPDLAGILITRDSLGTHGALVHDALYRCDGRMVGKSFSRAQVDEMFYRIMLADGVSAWRARLAYWAVRLFARRF